VTRRFNLKSYLATASFPKIWVEIKQLQYSSQPIGRSYQISLRFIPGLASGANGGRPDPVSRSSPIPHRSQSLAILVSTCRVLSMLNLGSLGIIQKTMLPSLGLSSILRITFPAKFYSVISASVTFLCRRPTVYILSDQLHKALFIKLYQSLHCRQNEVHRCHCYHPLFGCLCLRSTNL